MGVFTLDLICPQGDEQVGPFILDELWTRVVAENRYQKYDWTVKVDPDVVFLPDRLRMALLSSKMLLGLAQEEPIFLSSCGKGPGGPLEVLSRWAVEAYARGKSACAKSPREEAHGQSCLFKAGVALSGIERLLASESCGTSAWATCESTHVAFAPFVDEALYKKCMVA